MGNFREDGSDPSVSTESCSDDGLGSTDSTDGEPNRLNRNTDLFRNYVLSTDDVGTWVWITTGLLLLTVPPIGLFVAGWLLLESIGTVDEKGIVHAPANRSMSRSLLLIPLAIGSLIFGALFQYLLFSLLAGLTGY